jgi:hypothetical protein
MGGNSQMSISGSADEAPVELLLLSRLNSYQRAPRTLVQSWEAARRASENDTARIFLDEGFGAWVAYFLNKNAAQNHSNYAGKADCNRSIANLDVEPASARKVLAAQVAAAIPPAIAEKVDRLYKGRIAPLLGMAAQGIRMKEKPGFREGI